MFTVKKRIEVSGAHRLSLPYESKCANFHGHNWIIYVTCQSEKLNENGMVVDFTEIKRIVSQLDHVNINDVLNPGSVPAIFGGEINPTAENIAKWLCQKIPYCVKVEVQESEGNVAIYEV